MTLTIKKDTPGQSPSSYFVMLDQSLVIARFDHDERDGMPAALRKAAEVVERANSMKIEMAATTAGVFG